MIFLRRKLHQEHSSSATYCHKTYRFEIETLVHNSSLHHATILNRPTLISIELGRTRRSEKRISNYKMLRPLKLCQTWRWSNTDGNSRLDRRAYNVNRWLSDVNATSHMRCQRRERDQHQSTPTQQPLPLYRPVDTKKSPYWWSSTIPGLHIAISGMRRIHMRPSEHINDTKRARRRIRWDFRLRFQEFAKKVCRP